MYNTEKYVGECLDSILAQTFQDYEVIIVDDCSTDKSCEVVESYIPKFGGKLKMIHLKVNSGGCAVPKNAGIRLARGEYLMFVDSDDAITETALEELYSTAKNFDADALHWGRWYVAPGETVTTDKSKLKEDTWEKIEKVTKSVPVSADISERINDFLKDKFWGATVSNFVSRNLISAENLTFPPCRTSEDFVFKLYILCFAKRLVRSSSIFYVWRTRKNSHCRAELSPQDRLSRWGSATFQEIKILDDFMNRLELFKNQPMLKYAIFDLLLRKNLPSQHQILPLYKQFPAWQLDPLIRRELAEVKDKTALTAFLFSRMNIFNLQLNQAIHLLNQQPKETQDFQRQQQIIQQQQQIIQQQAAQLQQLQHRLNDIQNIFR